MRLANILNLFEGQKFIKFTSASKMRPWDENYLLLKEKFIVEQLNNDETLYVFREGRSLPKKYGIGIDERCIEYPWVLSRIPLGPARLLDAGSALNHEFLLNIPQLQDKKKHILTLFPEKFCYWQTGTSYLYEDIRKMPLETHTYDYVICISTLEHIGCDNSIYTGDKNYQENKPESQLAAIRELWRVLKPGGALYLTVPYGKFEDLGFSVQFDENSLRSIIKKTDFQVEVLDYFRYTLNGWERSTADECADCNYVEWIAKAWREGKWPDKIPLESDGAAAARAVACAHLVKPDLQKNQDN